VIDFEMLASRCKPGEAIRRLRQLANLPEDATRRLPVNTRAQLREINTAGPWSQCRWIFWSVAAQAI